MKNFVTMIRGIALLMLVFLTGRSESQTFAGDQAERYKKMVLGSYNYNYDCSNHLEYLTHAKNLIDQDNLDSSFKARKILQGLEMYDSIYYTSDIIFPLLATIREMHYKYLLRGLEGRWQFRNDFWYGMSSKVSTSVPSDTLKSMLFTDTEVIFFFKDSMYRSTPYKIIPRGNDEYQSSTSFLLVFQDNSEKNSISFFERLKSPDLNTVLVIGVDPDCGCGCQTLYYKRIEQL